MVSPMRGTAVAMPAASRARGRDLAERLNIVAENDDDGKMWMERFESRRIPDDQYFMYLYLTLFPALQKCKPRLMIGWCPCYYKLKIFIANR